MPMLKRLAKKICQPPINYKYFSKDMLELCHSHYCPTAHLVYTVLTRDSLHSCRYNQYRNDVNIEYMLKSPH